MDNTTRKRLIEHGRMLLENFHAANDNNPNGLESASWRGRVAEFRGTIEVAFGSHAVREVLEILREENGIPHCGPVANDGTIYGMDSEASLGL
jgi:hypothetical protein